MTWEYCEKQDVINFSGVSETKINDAWSEMVEGMISDHTGMEYEDSVQYTDNLDGTGTTTIFTKHSPILSVVSVSISGSALSSSEYRVYETHLKMVQDSGSRIDQAMGNTGVIWPVGTQNISIIYTAGYSRVPGKVKMCAMLMISNVALIGERGGSDSIIPITQAGDRYGAQDRGFSRDISGRLKRIMVNTLGDRMRFK